MRLASVGFQWSYWRPSDRLIYCRCPGRSMRKISSGWVCRGPGAWGTYAVAIWLRLDVDRNVTRLARDALEPCADLFLWLEVGLAASNQFVGRLTSFNQVLIPCYEGERASIVCLTKQFEVARRSIRRAFLHSVHKLGRR
jgi:hypothetical protein